MRYALLVLDAPHSRAAPLTALRFARAAVARGHAVTRVFFYGDGVHAASALAVPPQDEIDVGAEWRAFAQAHGTALVACIAAGLRRGVLDEGERARYGKPAASQDAGFLTGGLGQLADATLNSDRVLTFGG